MHGNASDEELMQAWRRGDARAFDALYARYRLPLFAFLKRHSGRSQAEVEEVFQDAWLKLIRAADDFDPRQAFAPWLFRIARNCMTDRWRHLVSVASVHVSDDEAMAGAGSDGLHQPERLAASRDIERRWREAIAALPPLQREVVLLKLEADLDLDAMAEITSAPRETVKSRLRYGLARLREMLHEVIDE